MNKNKKSVLKSKNSDNVPAKNPEAQQKDKIKAKNVTEKIKAKKEKVKKTKVAIQPTLDTPNVEKEITEAELKKIEKKKAKKLAQKLKKAQKKAVGKDGGDKEAPKAQKKATEKEVPKKEKNAKKRKLNNDQATTEKPTSEGVPAKKKKNNKKNKLPKDETESPVAASKAADSSKASPKPPTNPAGERVLLKKEKKLKKRQQLKEQKLAEKSTRDPATDAATVFVGNVPVNTKRVQLIRIFQKYGPVNSIRLRSAGGKILHKHKMRKAAGSLNAYVVLTSKDAAEKSLELNGTEFKGVHLRVTKSTEKNVAASAELIDEAKRTIFVGNLKYTATEESLRETFSSCGEVQYVRCIRDGEKGCKGVAYVRFKSTDAVGLALELNQTILDDRPINVERYSAKKLGAKEQRDALAAKENKNNPKQNKGKKGDNSKKPKKFNDKGKPNQEQGDGDDNKKAKKSEFRGVKVEALKKKLKMKKKKTNQASEIAKKIAPRPKKEE